MNPPQFLDGRKNVNAVRNVATVIVQYNHSDTRM